MTAHLIYVVGASGGGKDTLIGYARRHLSRHTHTCFAHRYITRPATAGGENHVALSPGEFAARRARRLFALHWSSHGLHYGIGIEINQWLAKGITVVVNGSREHLEEARRLYPELLPVSIEVSPDVLGERLRARGREDPQAIEQRLQRNRELHAACRGGARVIHNDGAIETAGDHLIRIITEHCPPGGEKTPACA